MDILVEDLRRALADGEFEVHYQPIIDVKTLSTVAMEALVRWRDPSVGLIPPNKFIPLAEDSGVIEPLGEWVMQRACADAARWPDDIKVAVNLSPLQFQCPDFARRVSKILRGAGLAPQRLELEITESVLLHDSDKNIGILHRLRRLGASIALDDFGTGYSSLSYLRTFPFDKIKIDRSFVAEIAQADVCAAIVCAVANLGRSLGITTTAEGVESTQQLELLRAAGCTQAQGFLFGRPSPVAILSFGPVVTAPSAALPASRSREVIPPRDLMLVRTSFSLVVPIQDQVASRFYARLFAIAPDLRPLFADDMTEQKRKLVAMLAACIGKLNDLATLLPAVRQLGERHAGYGTEPRHYALVGDALLWTLAQELGEAFTPEVRAAWVAIYDLLAATMLAGSAVSTSRAAS